MLPAMPRLIPGPAPECDPMPETEIAPLLDKAAKKQELPVKLLRAVVEQESALRPCAVSDQGASGLMQLMPDTAAQLKVADVFNPEENLAAGAAYLRSLIEKYKGDLSLSLAAYNAGPDAVDRISAIPEIDETKTYVKAIEEKFGAKQIQLPPIPKP
jgi:soluble lytic murein transglycosylase-like protein